MAARADAVTLRLWAEFAALFIAVPLAIALFLPPEDMFTALFAFTALGLVLLWRTGGFEWRSLIRGWSRIRWDLVAALAVVVVVTGVTVLWFTNPRAIFHFARTQPAFLLVVFSLYPLLSALPQELIFRALFFHRYGRLMQSRRGAILLNASVFSLAHLMYWSPLVLVMTFFGGAIFARAYLLRGFPSAWVLHAVAGNALFAVGMGVYFYSGNVVRPF